MAGDPVQEIKERLSIQEVVAPYVKLHKAGRSMTGLCPFHKEKTPSFHVSVERNTYHCFGCGEGGDIFSFIQKAEGLEFKEALKLLAEKAGVQLTHASGAREQQSRTERMREALARAQQWYAAQLSGSAAEAYAKNRGLSDVVLQDWGLGLAPDSWRALLETLTAEGFSAAELAAAGLIKEADGKPGVYYDRFRGRLLFPIRDTNGRVVAFTGRILPSDAPAKQGAAAPAKYLNSPETDLYHKSEIIFGLDRAKDAIRLRRFTLLVEGQMDVLMSHQAGFTNAVALSGTAFTAKHAQLLKRYSENLLLVLDADSAGLGATAKSAALALAHGMRVKAARLPEGKDPADLILEDAPAFATRIKEAKPVVEFFLAVLAARESDPHRLLALAERIVLPLIAAIPSPMERELFVQSTARTLGLSNESVRESLVRLPAQASFEEPPARTRQATAEERSARESRAHLLLAVLHAYGENPLAERIKREYLRITEAVELPAGVPDESALFEAERLFGHSPAENAADELLRAFEEAVIREAYQRAVTSLRQAESAGDADAITKAQTLCVQLAARRAALK